MKAERGVPCFFDSHCHLNDEAFREDYAAVIHRAQEGGVREMLIVGYDLPSSHRAVEIAQNFSGVYAAVGVHPHEAKTVTAGLLHEIEELLTVEKVLALGEIGLDYYYDYSPREIQREVFGEFLALAKKTGKPVIIHDREAHGEVLEILKATAGQNSPGFQGVMHCYSASPEMLPNFLKLGFHISIAGPVTFKNAKRLPEVLGLIPRERLLLETDSPYLAPFPYRGKRNEPLYLLKIADRVGKILGETIEEVGEVTSDNARRLFGII